MAERDTVVRVPETAPFAAFCPFPYPSKQRVWHSPIIQPQPTLRSCLLLLTHIRASPSQPSAQQPKALPSPNNSASRPPLPPSFSRPCPTSSLRLASHLSLSTSFFASPR